MKCWTDYPSIENCDYIISQPMSFRGSKEHRALAKMRQIEIVGFDHDKYVTLADGEEIKAGYCYRSRRKVPFKYTTLIRNFPHHTEDLNV